MSNGLSFLQNEVASLEEKQVGEADVYQKTFSLTPAYTPGKHWVAVKDDVKEHKTSNLFHTTPRSLGQNKTLVMRYFKNRTFRLASSVMLKERSLFMIKVLYFVQVRVSTSRFSRDLILKVPFILAPNSSNS